MCQSICSVPRLVSLSCSFCQRRSDNRQQVSYCMGLSHPVCLVPRLLSVPQPQFQHQACREYRPPALSVPTVQKYSITLVPFRRSCLGLHGHGMNILHDFSTHPHTRFLGCSFLRPHISTLSPCCVEANTHIQQMVASSLHHNFHHSSMVSSAYPGAQFSARMAAQHPLA